MAFKYQSFTTLETHSTYCKIWSQSSNQHCVIKSMEKISPPLITILLQDILLYLCREHHTYLESFTTYANMVCSFNSKYFAKNYLPIVHFQCVSQNWK